VTVIPDLEEKLIREASPAVTDERVASLDTVALYNDRDSEKSVRTSESGALPLLEPPRSLYNAKCIVFATKGLLIGGILLGVMLFIL